MVRSVFSHKDLAKLSLEYVGVMSHRNPDHGEGEFLVKGKKRHLCNLYDLPNCESHAKVSSELARRGLLKGVRGTPTHIVYNPHDLKELGRYNYMNVSQIEDAIKAAQKVLGKPVRYKDFARMRETLDAAKAKLTERDYRGALKALKGFDARGMKSIEAEAKALKESVMSAGRDLLAKAKAALEGGEKEEAKKFLREVLKGFSGTDLAKEAKSLLEKTKE